MMKGEGNLATGKRGEVIAASFLRGKKFSILEMNYRCRAGEVDIIARDGNELVFVEVKTRRTTLFGPPQASVTRFKQRQISKAALAWLAHNKFQNTNARFDVVAVLLRDHDVPQIEHIRNAFDLDFG